MDADEMMGMIPLSGMTSCDNHSIIGIRPATKWWLRQRDTFGAVLTWTSAFARLCVPYLTYLLRHEHIKKSEGTTNQ